MHHQMSSAYLAWDLPKVCRSPSVPHMAKQGAKELSSEQVDSRGTEVVLPQLRGLALGDPELGVPESFWHGPSKELEASLKKGLDYVLSWLDSSTTWDMFSTPTTPSPRNVGILPVLHSDGEMVRWNVDARKLESSEKQLLSPEFLLNLPDLGPTPFRLMILAKETRGRGGRAFRKAKGHGRLFLKCARSEVPKEMTKRWAFRAQIGGKSKVVPAGHEFGEHSCCPLQDDENWDLLAEVDQDTKKLQVILEVL